MNKKNINMIMYSKLGLRMTKHKNFEDTKILAPDNFQSLWVFFHHTISNKTLNNYLKQGQRMCMTKGALGGCEGLDGNEIIEVYGTKVIVFS